MVIPSGSEFDESDLASPTEMFDPNANLDLDFTPGPLPLWAKKQIPEETDVPSRLAKGIDLPKGRWAQRIEQSGISVRSVYDKDSFIALPEQEGTIKYRYSLI